MSVRPVLLALLPGLLLSFTTAQAAASLEKNGAILSVAAPALDKLQAEDAAHADDKSRPARYGVLHALGGLEVRPGNGVGIWREDGQTLHWQLRIEADGAQSLSLAFARLRLPHGALLRMRSADGTQALAALSDADNPRDGGPLHTALLQADAIVLELSVPAHKREALQLVLDAVVWGYRDPLAAIQAKSGNCNVDAVCPEGNAWRKQIDSVALYTFQGQACTGTLLNTGDNGADVIAPRFATAHHCINTAAAAESVVLYWGYESPVCRALGSSANGTALTPPAYHARAVQVGGADLVASNADTDFSVLELRSRIPGAARAYYSGWDRSGAIPSGSVGIHHPQGHAKRITFNTDALQTSRNCLSGNWSLDDSHWHVSGYELGTTERGSSGSGLWNRDNGLLIGVLSGGSAQCNVPEGSDCYGRLSSAWEAASSTGVTVRAALDRTGGNPDTLAGKGSCNAPNVELSSDAFTTAPAAGEYFELHARASGGSGHVYHWDVDGDGVFERSGSQATVRVSFPTARTLNVRVQVQDSAGCSTSISHALEIAGPRLDAVSVGTPVQVCGNDNGALDPGERFSLPVSLRNDGTADLEAGAHALFAPRGQLRLEAPTVPLPALAAGESTTVHLDLALPGDIACDTELALDYIATADAGHYSTGFKTLSAGRVGAGCQRVERCPAQVETIDLRDGNYYNPQRSGNGFNSYAYGGIWYSADAHHMPTWYSVVGSYQDNLLQAPVQYTRNAASPQTPAPRVEHAVLGTAYLARIDADHLLLAWRLDNGSAGAERLSLTSTGLARATPDHTQHWYPPSQSGWGLDVESLHVDGRNRDFSLLYFYDANGLPRWVIGEREMLSHRPHCPGCPHHADWNARRQPAGQIELIWNADAGSINTDISLPAPLQGRWQRGNVPLQPIGEVRP